MATRIEYSPYQLKARRALNRFGDKNVNGYLLRVHFDEGKVGYSSLQTWEELGDASLESELAALAFGKPLRLGYSALSFARKDAEARLAKQYLYKDLQLKNYYSLGLIDDTTTKEEIPICFNSIKIKVDPGSIKNLSRYCWLKDFHLRFDFNHSLSSEFEQDLEKILAEFNVDYVEDPGFVTKKIPIAYDQKKPPGQISIAVVKPVKEEPASISANKFVFTSYMDHPLNLIHAARAAQDFYRENPGKQELCGLRTDLLFQDDNYLQLFAKSTDGIEVSEDGYGIGFTSLLEKEKWQKLIG